MNNVLAFGEILWDIIDGKAHLGGAPLNFAAHCKQCGLPSAIISAVGDDAYGISAIEQVQQLGVRTDFIQTSKYPTGTVIVKLQNGQPDYEIIQNVAYDDIHAEWVDIELAAQFEYFYFGTLAQRNQQSRTTLDTLLTQINFRDVFYDINLRKNSYTPEHILWSLGHCTIFKINDEEVEIVRPFLKIDQSDFEAFSKNLIRQFPNIKTIIITSGAKGCYVYDGSAIMHIPSQPVKVADTVGAGDSFSAAFLSVYNRTGNVQQAATLANKVGGFVASCHGAIPTYPVDLLQDLSLAGN